jgi:LmbE family N-acetylglucosaminyl deacetylase
VPASTGGLALVDRSLARLITHRRLLVIGAHPDDEDTFILAWVARGQGGEAAYLSLSRGEGGQNLIGTELGVGLGLLRSRELQAAREVDGARQYFSRAYDFGYTRSLEEALNRWPREEIVLDALRVVRRFRPQVIVSTFPASERAGHGQHQAAAFVAQEVFRLAGDGDAGGSLKDEGLVPWQPTALYRSGFFDPDSPALEVSLSQVDPFDGRSVKQLAWASRSQHRSQDMGSLQDPGPGSDRLIPVAGETVLEGGDPFAGIDTSLPALASLLPQGEARTSLEARLRRVETLARTTRQHLSPTTVGAAVEPLAEILNLLELARADLPSSLPAVEKLPVEELLTEKIRLAQTALTAATGLVVDAFTERTSIIPGEALPVTLRAWNSGDQPVELTAVDFDLPTGWTAKPAAESDSGLVTLGAGEFKEWQIEVQVPPAAEPSLPYFLRRPRQGDLYDWTGISPQVRGTPFEKSPVTARFAGQMAGAPFTLEREVVHRSRDQAVGEVRRPLQVVPKLQVVVSEPLLLWPLANSEAREVEVELINESSTPLAGELRTQLPPGWPTPPPRAFELAAQGGRQRWTVALEPPAGLAAGEYRVRFEAAAAGEVYAAALPVVDYPHIRPAQRLEPAEVVIRAGELTLPKLGRVGYIRGASDRVPEALAQIGLPVELLSPEKLAEGDLSGFDVIVVGSRAYETDPALAQANERLLAYVRAGGGLIVQYQQYQFVSGGFAPFPLDIARPHGRITDESAAVRVLDPAHPIFNTPHRLGDEDWQGWVQERGLYFADTWSPEYRPLLAMADPGGPELEGGLLVAPLGRGVYVYTGLAFFRQLPGGVLGGARLFLNLLSFAAHPGEKAG